MQNLKTELSKFNNSWYNPGRNVLVRGAWFCIQGVFFSSWIPGSVWRCVLLRLFGAKVGKKVVIKPRVIIKYPWNISLGDYTWIGEKVWLDSLGKINIGNNCCISQGAHLICGNHNYKKQSFDLMVGNITLENGVWIGTLALVTGGVVCGEESVLSAGSIASKSMDSYGIYSGNPALKIRERLISR